MDPSPFSRQKPIARRSSSSDANSPMNQTVKSRRRRARARAASSSTMTPLLSVRMPTKRIRTGSPAGRATGSQVRATSSMPFGITVTRRAPTYSPSAGLSRDVWIAPAGRLYAARARPRSQRGPERRKSESPAAWKWKTIRGKKGRSASSRRTSRITGTSLGPAGDT